MGRKKSKKTGVSTKQTSGGTKSSVQPQAVFEDANFGAFEGADKRLQGVKADKLFEKLFSNSFGGNADFFGNCDLQGVISGGDFAGLISGAQAFEFAPADPQKVLADFFDILDYQRKQRGNLLGVFADGEYSIGEQMRQQLLLLPKKFENMEDSTAWASTKLGSFVINFKVVFDISNTFCGAKLFVIETESDVDENVKHITLLDEVLQVYDYYFRDEMFKKWNIFRDEQQLEKIGVVQRYLEMQADDLRFGRELDDLLSQLYLARMLQLLNSLGEKGEKARKEFAEVVSARLQQEPAFSQEFATQKMLLDNILIELDVFEEVVKTEDGLKILQAYTKPLQNLRQTRTEVISEKLETQKQKSETSELSKKTDLDANNQKSAAKSAKSAGAGGAGGSGGGKDQGKAPSFNMKDVGPLNLGGGVTKIGGTPTAGKSNAGKPNTGKSTAPAGPTAEANNQTARPSATPSAESAKAATAIPAKSAANNGTGNPANGAATAEKSADASPAATVTPPNAEASQAGISGNVLDMARNLLFEEESYNNLNIDNEKKSSTAKIAEQTLNL